MMIGAGLQVACMARDRALSLASCKLVDSESMHCICLLALLAQDEIRQLKTSAINPSCSASTIPAFTLLPLTAFACCVCPMQLQKDGSLRQSDTEGTALDVTTDDYRPKSPVYDSTIEWYQNNIDRIVAQRKAEAEQGPVDDSSQAAAADDSQPTPGSKTVEAVQPASGSFPNPVPAEEQLKSNAPEADPLSGAKSDK